MREYISPNWHAVLVHAPLGLLSVGIILELLGFLWRRSGLRPAARWMILVGAVTSVPAITSGIYAYRDVLSPNTTGVVDFQDNWYARDADSDGLTTGTVKDRTGEEKIVDVPVNKFLESRPGRLLRDHILYNSVGIAVIFLVVVLWIALSDNWRRRLYLPLLLLLIAGKGAVVYGSHDGGQAVYVHGVAIEPLATTNESSMAPTRQERLMQYLPPAQLHFTMAGWVVAIALVALAMSIRAITQPEVTAADEAWFETKDGIGEELPPPPLGTAGSRSTAVGVAGPPDPGLDPVADDPTTTAVAQQRRVVMRTGDSPHQTVVVAPVTSPRVPSARFWLLTAVLGLVAFGSGLWVISFWTWGLGGEAHVRQRARAPRAGARAMARRARVGDRIVLPRTGGRGARRAAQPSRTGRAVAAAVRGARVAAVDRNRADLRREQGTDVPLHPAGGGEERVVVGHSGDEHAALRTAAKQNSA